MAARKGRSVGKRRSRWKVAAGVIVATLGVAGVSLAVIVWLLLHPPKNEPTSADVVLVIAGATDGRHDLGAELVKAGVADNLVVSNPAGLNDEVGSSLCRGENQPEGVNTWCMNPVPSTTTGEAQTFERLAQEQGWETAVAVTNRPHHHRVRLNFAQCTSVDTAVVSTEGLTERSLPYLVARELGGYVKHFLTNPC